MAKQHSIMIPEVDAYIAKSAPFAKPILEHLREIIHTAAPEVVEEIKWSRPFFVYNGIILGNISAFKAHCSFGLWGTEMAQQLRSDGVASSEGMGTFGRITSLDDLPPKKQLLAYVKEAARKIAEGERTKSIDRPKPADRPKPNRVAKANIELPAVLTAALAKHPVAARHFAAMSPSCRKEYATWISDAKREETRLRRAEQAIEMIAEGKSRNWKYETK